jgi:hypothetical protein
MISPSDRFAAAMRRFNEANGEDPNRECSLRVYPRGAMIGS